MVRAYREYGKGEEFSSWLRNSLADGALDFGEVRDESGAIVSMPENFSPEAAATLAQELARGKSVEGVVSMLEEHVRSLSERGEAEYGADKAALVKAATAETHKRSGSRWKSWTMSGKAVEGTYRIVDAQAVRFRDSASSEERNFQGRDRGSKQSEAQVYKIADELNPERLGANDYTDRGAPIVNGELYSVAGEGRTRAIRTAYGLMPNASGRALENGKAYRAFVEKFAREHGLEIPADVKHPMIVRVMERSDVSESELTKDTNRDVKADHSRAEAANENAEYVASLLPLWNPGKNGDPRAASNAAFMNAFMAKIGKDTSGAMFDIDASGRKVWTEEAAELVLDAVFAHVVNDVELVRRMFRNPRRYGGAYDGVYRTAFELVELNGSAYALGNSLRDALIKYEELKRARENTPSGKTLTLEDFLAQGELGLSGETGAIDGLTRALLETFDAFSDARGNGVRRVLHSYAQQAMRLDSGAEADMLVGAGEKPSAESVLRAGLAVMKGESVSPHSIYGALYERGDDGSLAKPTLFQRGGGDMRRTTAQDTRRILDRVKNWIPNAKVKIVKNVRDAVRQANSVRESRVFNDRFNSELEAFENGTIKGELHLGSPGEILRACGLGSSEIFIKPTVLRQHISKHGITVSDIQNLPEALNDPLMVYEWGTKAKSLIVITDLTVKDGRKITAAVKLERDGKRVEVNELASVHGKSAERLLNEATEKESDFGKNKLKYVDKGKAAEWLSNIPPKGTTERTRQLHLRNIIERFENPSTENSPDHVKWLRNRLGEAFGAYLPATGEIFIAENARADTVLHELGWHATYAWARANNPQLYAKMREYALTAPAEVRERVAKDYGREDGKISDEEFVDEVGAALFGDENADKVEALLQTKEARTWWAKLKEAVGKLWKAFLTAVGGNRADVRAMAEMSPREAMNKLAEEFLAGKRLAAMNERAEADARESVRWQQDAAQDAGTREEPQDLEASAQKYSVLVRQIGTLLTAGMLRKGLNMDGKFAQEGISKTETTTPQDKAMEYARKLFKGESDAVLLDAVDYAREAAGNILDKRAALGKGLFRSSKEAFAAIKTARQEERFRTKFSRKLRELASVNLDPVKFARAQAFVERRNRLKKQGRLSETKALTDKELAARNVPPLDIATLAGAESAEWAERVKSAVYAGKEADDADALNQLRETLYRAYAAAAKNSALDSATAAAVARRAERMRASANTLNQVMAAAEREALNFYKN